LFKIHSLGIGKYQGDFLLSRTTDIMFGGKQVTYEPGLDLACKEFTWEVRKGALSEYKI
jgi:hypothetical protein